MLESLSNFSGTLYLVYGFVGYRKRDQFSKVLDYVSSGSYQKMDFESFENMLDFEEDN